MDPSPPENSDIKAAFRKLSSNAATRNYRRRSPTDGSSSPAVDPELGHSSSTKYAREDPVIGHDYRKRKKDGEKDLSGDSSRTPYGNSGDPFRYSERHSSRSSYAYSRHDDHRRRESDHSRSRDYMRDRDRYSRDRNESSSYRSKDRENHGSSRDHWSGWEKEEPKGHHSKSTAGKDHDGQKLVKERRGFENSDSVKDGDCFDRGFKKPLGDRSISQGNRNSPNKKPCLFSSDGGPDLGKDVGDDGRQQSQEVNDKANSAQVNATASEVANDLDAAKFAAMRAAELVNRNLAGGTGYMSTEQKKKLLWGNKKGTTTEEHSACQWDVSLIADPERQEKFNKLMGVKGDVKFSEQKPGNEDQSSQIQAEKQKELQLNLEKQYTAGLRRRDGRTVGLGL